MLYAAVRIPDPAAQMLVFVLALFVFAIAFALLSIPAAVSSQCDKLMDALKKLRKRGDKTTAERVRALLDVL